MGIPRDQTIRRRGAGVTFIEILVATLIVGVALIPIFRGFTTVTTSVVVTRDRMTGLLLAQSILESLRFRLYHEESRFFDLSTPDAEIIRRVQDGRWQDFFKSLGHEARGIVSSPSMPISTYFATFLNPGGTGPTPLSPSLDPEFCRRLARFSCLVQVAFQSPEGEIIDPDADGRQAYDMAWVTVTVRWKSDRAPGAPEKSVSFTSLLSERTASREGG